VEVKGQSYASNFPYVFMVCAETVWLTFVLCSTRFDFILFKHILVITYAVQHIVMNLVYFLKQVSVSTCICMQSKSMEIQVNYHKYLFIVILTVLIDISR